MAMPAMAPGERLGPLSADGAGGGEVCPVGVEVDGVVVEDVEGDEVYLLVNTYGYQANKGQKSTHRRGRRHIPRLESNLDAVCVHSLAFRCCSTSIVDGHDNRLARIVRRDVGECRPHIAGRNLQPADSRELPRVCRRWVACV